MATTRRRRLVFVTTLLCCTAGARSAAAYDRYSVNGNATNCRACHGDFRAANYTSLVDGQAWGNLHNLHRQIMLSGDCNTCHGNSTFPVMLASSNGGNGLAAIGCVGCHGREEDNVAANPELPNGRGAGLRQHHTHAGVAICQGCHLDALPANYACVGEDVLPPYYAAPGNNHPNMPTDSCNPVPLPTPGDENYAGTSIGLDNDGDGVYDMADSNCVVAVCGNGVVEGNEQCDTGAESATCNADCTNAICGDGKLNATAGETCDTSGESITCDADCTAVACGDGTVNATAGEACDTGGESATCNSDCTVVACGDGKINASAGELCDPQASCPSTCDDLDACTTDTMAGSAATCDAACSNVPVTTCTSGDGCCPAGCTAATDDDCSGGTGGGGGGTGGSGATGGGGSGASGGSGANGGGGSGASGGSGANGGGGSGANGTGGSGTGNEGAPGGSASSEDTGGCGCRVAPQSRPLGALLLGLWLAAFARRRRRGASAR